MIKSISILTIILFSGLSTYAQSYEIGAMLGGSNYHGDIAYNIVPAETNLSGGIFYKYNFNEYWSMRPTLSYIEISGADSNFTDYKLRNLSFRNKMAEVSNIVEFNFQPFSNKAIHNRTTFYALAGISLAISKPEAQLDGEWFDLRKYGTEGQKYSQLQLAIPFGGGIKLAISPNFILGVEVGWRKTFTDYLDDVSNTYPDLTQSGSVLQRLSDRSREVSDSGDPLSNAGDMRGDPGLNDWYFQTAFTIAYRFTPIQCAFKINHFK